VTAVETKAPAEVRKFPLTTLIAMVVGSMVGAGIFLIAVAGFISGIAALAIGAITI